MIKAGYCYYTKFLEEKVSSKGFPYVRFQLSEKKDNNGTIEYCNYSCVDFTNPKLSASGRTKILEIISVDQQTLPNGRRIVSMQVESAMVEENGEVVKPKEKKSIANLIEDKSDDEMPF